MAPHCPKHLGNNHKHCPKPLGHLGNINSYCLTACKASNQLISCLLKSKRSLSISSNCCSLLMKGAHGRKRGALKYSPIYLHYGIMSQFQYTLILTRKSQNVTICDFPLVCTAEQQPLLDVGKVLKG